jgi:NADPH2:quinone reductase
MRAIQIQQPGGPESLELVDIPDPVPDAGEVLARVTAAGVNFIDTYRRSGVYPVPFPHVPGDEGAGVVVAVGDGVDGVAVGDRIAWTDAPGSYAELVRVKASRVLPVPDGVALDTAAALPLQGMTAHYLATSTYPLGGRDVALIHAGAGGVGLLLTQLAVSRGARVITTVSSAEKEELSRSAGAADVIRYDQLQDLTAELPARVRGLSDGGVTVVYDGVGRSTFDASLASLRRRGMLVLFGGASGQVPPFDPQRLNTAGSLYVTRPKLGDYIVTAEELRQRSDEVFAAVAAGDLAVRIGARFPLAEAADAHRALEGRATTGKVLLEIG